LVIWALSGTAFKGGHEVILIFKQKEPAQRPTGSSSGSMKKEKRRFCTGRVLGELK